MTNQRTQFISTRGRGSVSAAGWGRNQNLTAFRSERRLGPVANTVMIILLTAFLGLLYLTQLTKTSAFGYEMNTIDEKKTQLAAERDDLKIENARLQSIARVESSSVAAAMTTPTDIQQAE